MFKEVGWLGESNTDDPYRVIRMTEEGLMRGRDGKEERKQKKNYELLCHFKERGQAKHACSTMSRREFLRDLLSTFATFISFRPYWRGKIAQYCFGNELCE